jgi:DNA repair photolyase
MSLADEADRRPYKGRGAVSNPAGRFESQRHTHWDDGWDLSEDTLPALETIVTDEPAKSIISYNDSPDIGFDRSINPYKGCEHGCIYCYARPSHGYLNLSAGLDFETKLFYKSNAAELLDQEFRKAAYRPAVIALGANTDPYQPIERRLGITRSILEVMLRFRHPLGIITKGAALVERDLDLLAQLARENLVVVAVTLTTLQAALKRTLEPRAASPASRLRLIRTLSDAGVPVRVMFSPVIPFINDAEMEQVLEHASVAGATMASSTFLRLPHEVKDLFREWLEMHYPLKAQHVMSLVMQSRGGKAYDSSFGSRMRGEGNFAELIAQRFRLAKRRYGLESTRHSFNLSAFRIPESGSDSDSVPGAKQLSLF